MNPDWMKFDQIDSAAFRITIEFLKERLEERETFDWALRLKPEDKVKRAAILYLINSIDFHQDLKVGEPWRSAWRLIEEAWNNQGGDDQFSTDAYDIQSRMNAGDKSGALVKKIVDLVAPKIEIEPFTPEVKQYRTFSKKPKQINDIFVLSLASGRIIDLDLVNIGMLTDINFTLSLGSALERAVLEGLDIGRRIGWRGKQDIWKLGNINRVYYVHKSKRSDGESEPDEFSEGMAPSVKLLYEIVARIAQIDISAAIEIAQRWRLTTSPVHVRLWAAIARNPQVVKAKEVGNFLISLDSNQFWDISNYPEIAELRATRFKEFNADHQRVLMRRIRKGPPRSFWPKNVDSGTIERKRLSRAVRELRRIEIGGATFNSHDKKWLDAKLMDHPNLAKMELIDQDFKSSFEIYEGKFSPDNRYDLLVGEGRLKALEKSFSTVNVGWGNDPATGALAWIRCPGNPLKVLTDFESIPDGGASFPLVWGRFGWEHTPDDKESFSGSQDRCLKECERVLTLLDKLPNETLFQSIHGISEWLERWKKFLIETQNGLWICLKIWPIAVETTNQKYKTKDEKDPYKVDYPSNNTRSENLDTLNEPAGKLVGVFIGAFKELQNNENPFDTNKALRKMRDEIIVAKGHAGLIARHKMIQALPYFLKCDPEWTDKHLIKPLSSDNADAIPLWAAVARQTLFKDVIKVIGLLMTERASDRRLTRETRQSLVFSLIVECLHAFNDNREPVVPQVRIQQMLRMLDDEVRVYGIKAVNRFIHDVSTIGRNDRNQSSAESLFRNVAKPFMEKVWPQEQSLVTPGVSKALANLPAIVEGAFAEAVYTIERFLVPFECWSISDYGLRGNHQDGRPKLSIIINNSEKADALLKLFDKTIGTAAETRVPIDLADALDHIRNVAPKAASSSAFKRLATATRRI